MGLPSSTISGFRSRWATRFVDTFEITRPGNRGTFNETTLQYDTPIDVGVYSGVGLIRPATSGDRRTIGDERQSTDVYALYLPYTATMIRPGDIAKGKSPSTYDVELVGKKWTVEHVHLDSYRTRTKVIVRRYAGGADYGDSG